MDHFIPVTDNFLCGHSHIELYENLKNGPTVSSAFMFNYYSFKTDIFHLVWSLRYICHTYIFHGVMPLISFRLQHNGPEEAKT